jgi:glycosyltransferase involved in cell wall biosynthesis
MAERELGIEELQRELAGRSWILIAGGSLFAAEEFAARQVTPPISTVGKDELVESRLQAIRARPIDAAVLLTSSWVRQRNPQFYGAALAGARAKRRYLVDLTQGRVRRVSSLDRLAILSGVPVSLAIAAGHVAVETAGFQLRRRRPAPVPVVAAPEHVSVLAVWIGSSGDTVGGSVSHISGILHGLRSVGARIGLLTMQEPPPQLAGAIDDVEMIPMLSASALASADIERIAVNRPARRAGMRLAARLRPTLVYQRHQSFLTAGADIATACRVPLILEWNASEVWTRANWEHPLKIERLLDPLLAAAELYVLRRSSLVAAVSDPAALMAHRLGVGMERIVTLPNGVDVKDIDRAVGSGGGVTPVPRRLGWIGSFGPWHGAEIAIEALAELPLDVELLMIGEGQRLSSCMLLAERLGVGARIAWTGRLAHDEAMRRLAGCSILLSPHVPLEDQEFFGSPTKLFEYMALERPIVASQLGQLGIVLENGRTAVLVEPHDPKALAAAVIELLREPERGRQMAVAARREAINRHGWERRARQLLDAVELSRRANT